MRIPIVLVLLCFWVFLAYRAFESGDTAYALVLVVVGIALAAWRLGIGRRTV
ncbi:MAG: hypothetical protein ACJ79K_05030 [Gemmatimonadaceae bacterium]